MASKTRITLTHDLETTGDLKNKFQTTSDRIRGEYNNLIDLIAAMAAGSMNGSLGVTIDDGNEAAASGTLTLASVVATNTCVVNGVTFTAVASGATGNQFNVGGTDTITATNLAAAINGSVTAKVVGVVTAAGVGAVVTVTAAVAGLIGNSLALAGGTNITASGAALSGGLNATTGTTVLYSK